MIVCVILQFRYAAKLKNCFLYPKQNDEFLIFGRTAPETLKCDEVPALMDLALTAGAAGPRLFTIHQIDANTNNLPKAHTWYVLHV